MSYKQLLLSLKLPYDVFSLSDVDDLNDSPSDSTSIDHEDTSIDGNESVSCRNESPVTGITTEGATMNCFDYFNKTVTCDNCLHFKQLESFEYGSDYYRCIRGNDENRFKIDATDCMEYKPDK